MRLRGDIRGNGLVVLLWVGAVGLGLYILWRLVA
jgi:hypothetical protein